MVNKPRIEYNVHFKDGRKIDIKYSELPKYRRKMLKGEVIDITKTEHVRKMELWDTRHSIIKSGQVIFDDNNPDIMDYREVFGKDYKTKRNKPSKSVKSQKKTIIHKSRE